MRGQGLNKNKSTFCSTSLAQDRASTRPVAGLPELRLVALLVTNSCAC